MKDHSTLKLPAERFNTFPKNRRKKLIIIITLIFIFSFVLISLTAIGGRRNATISGAAWLNRKSGQSDILRGFEIIVCNYAVEEEFNLARQEQVVEYELYTAKRAEALKLQRLPITNLTSSQLALLREVGRGKAKAPYHFLDLNSLKGVILTHAATVIKTDIDGKYIIPALPFGDYFLYADYSTEFSKAYWFIEVKVDSRKLISINFDNSNAVEIYSKD